MQLSEQVVTMGSRKSLVGIFTQSVGMAASVGDVTVVILNTGIIHRVGHHRMYLTFSRALAGAGYNVLRFDFSGIGDSDNREDGLPPLESCLADIKESLDWLEVTKHAKRVILVGLCSGADYGVVYAHSDPRVIGLVLLDPSIPPTRRYFRDYLGRRALSLRSWFNVAFGASRVRRMLIERVIGMVAKNWEPRYPTLSHPQMRSQLERLYQAAIDRDVMFLVVLTSGGRHTYPEQLLEAFPNVAFLKQLRLEFFDDCDHKFTPEASRARLLQLIRDWLHETNFRPALVVNGAILAAKVVFNAV
jgi:pimeloyl-ACP methyl ester carboxylesterase